MRKNRYIPIKTDDVKVQILDTIIRFPDTTLMTREALAIREQLPEIAEALFSTRNVELSQDTRLISGRAKQQVLCATLGSGWEPFPDLPFRRDDIGYIYKIAVTQIASYLVSKGQLYEDLTVA